MRFQRPDGSVASTVVPVQPRSRVTVDAGSIAGLASTSFSTLVDSDEPVVVDRTMSWGNGLGSHAEHAVPVPATTWYFAEGATHSGFDLFYLLQNPGDEDADVEVRFVRPAPAAPVTRQYRVAAHSRADVWVDTEGPELDDTDVAAIVTSTRPVVVERAMYRGVPGQPFAAGHDSAGVTEPATSWYFAEGATGGFFDLFLLVLNPADRQAPIRATYLLPGGATVVNDYLVPAHSRFNVWVDLEDTALADTAVSAEVTSLDGVPIVVERAMWWPGSSTEDWREAHGSPGATATGTTWALAEGEEGGPANVETYLLVANASAFEGLARVTLLFEDGTTASGTWPLIGKSRFDVPVGTFFPEAAGKRFGVIVESLPAPGATAAAQIVVERSMYSDAGGVTWAAGTSALGRRIQ